MTVKEKGSAVAEAAEFAVSEAQIAVHWREAEYIRPPPEFVAQANADDPAILQRYSEEHFPECFTEYSDMLPGSAGGTRRSMRTTLRSGGGSSAGA